VKIEVLFFAILRERAGRERETLEVPAATTAADLMVQLVRLHPGLAGLEGRVQLAVNRQMVPRSHVLRDHDEVALIPPVSGGSNGEPERPEPAGEAARALPPIAVSPLPLSLEDVVAAVRGDEQGGVCTFVGQVRRQGTLPDVRQLEYEAFVPMAVEVLTGIAREIELEYPGVRVAIHHRIGTLRVGEAAVVIAASAPHRAEAFASCRVAIERLKQRAPIWKKEIGDSGAVWVGQGP
jgi:molybdopterin converting factor subunit 1